MMNNRYLYLMVTNDKYELPLIVADTRKEIAIFAGVDSKSVASGIKRSNKGYFSRYIRIKVEE